MNIDTDPLFYCKDFNTRVYLGNRPLQFKYKVIPGKPMCHPCCNFPFGTLNVG